jgi:hypothetical protein
MVFDFDRPTLHRRSLEAHTYIKESGVKPTDRPHRAAKSSGAVAAELRN